MTLSAIDFHSATAAADFVESLRQTGFGVIRNHPLPEQQVTDIYEHWLDFFHADNKHDYCRDDGNTGGFIPVESAESAKGRELRDLKEYFHFYPNSICPPELRNELMAYYDGTVAFAATLLSWIEQETPIHVQQTFSEPLSSMINGSQQSLLRILHYPPLTTAVEPGAVRAAAHEDINLITILPASNEPGLQVQTRDGTWLDVPTDFGNLIINSGDMLQEASAGYYPSTTHRVINPDGAARQHSRISLPLFLHPRPEVVLSPRHTAGSYLAERLNELQQASN